MKLSVIIPVYSVESTLDRCVESVLLQHVEDMEVILVDDGSPDRCPQMCDLWAAKDLRINVIHQQNNGLSAARNVGLDKATGDLITFVDSDDYLADNTYPALMKMMADCDILEYSIAGRLKLPDYTFTDRNEYWLQTQAYTHTYAWNKIFRRSLFEGIRFPIDMVFEDVYILPLLLHKARKVSTTHLGHYHYTSNPKSITATAGGQELAQLLNAHLASNMPIDDHYYMYLVNIQIDVWERTGATILLPARQVDYHLLYGNKKFKAIILNYIGINRLCKLSKLIHHFKKPNHS